MTNFVLLLSLCVVAAYGIQEGDYCTKNGIPGVCTNITQCPDAREDIKNRIKPHLCDFTGLFPIVCCISSVTTTTTTNTTTTTSYQKGNCVLPPYPDHGTYVTSIPKGKPGEAYNIFALNVTCDQDYVVDGSPSIFCQNGWWPDQMPKCVTACKLPPHLSFEYNCLITVGESNVSRICKEYEPEGVIASPRCQGHQRSTKASMICINGSWDQIATCVTECGVLTPNGTELVLGGEVAKYGVVPWHAAIYRDSVLICGGSLVSTSIVITAAHCVWDDVLGRKEGELGGRLPASEFIVAVGKLYRDINNKLGTPQWSKVEIIHIPPRFRGSTTSFQDDIAVMEMSTPFEYRPHIRPVCLDFDAYFESNQLQPGNKGQMVGWGRSTTENGSTAEVLRVVELPYIDIDTCINKLPASFRPFITSDKICAELDYDRKTSAVCRDDGGSGLFFPSLDKGKSRYYLRGILSAAPTGVSACSFYATFTRLIKHERFIVQHWRD